MTWLPRNPEPAGHENGTHRHFAAVTMISTQQAWSPQTRGLQAGADGWMLRIDPLVPGVVVIGEIVHVGEPDGCGQELGFVGAGRVQEPVDLPEHLAGLLLDVAERSGGIRCHSAKIDDRAVHRCEADDRNARGSIRICRFVRCPCLPWR